MSIGDFPESLSQQILVGIMLVGRLGVASSSLPPRLGFEGRRKEHGVVWGYIEYHPGMASQL